MMTYNKETLKKIEHYKEQVRNNMRHMNQDEAEEVIIDLQEQIDIASVDSIGSPSETKIVAKIITNMASPESFANPTANQDKIPLRPTIALTLAILSWAFNIGAIEFFALYGLVWFSIIAASATLAIMSYKSTMSKIAIIILILEVLSFPIIHSLSGMN